MLKKYPIIKWSLLTILSLIVVVVAFGFWFVSLLPSGGGPKNFEATMPSDLPYLKQSLPANRGKILAVVTSQAVMGSSGKKTGYELTELSRPYYVFQANGFEVDIASPKGGQPPVVIDDDDMGPFDFAFLNDSIAQQKAKNTLPIKAVDPAKYEAVFFVGGKGAMFDFPNNKAIQELVQYFDQNNKVIGAVCHGPAALVGATNANGRPILENKTVSSFTNQEELLLIPDAPVIFPFLLQDELKAQGANFQEGQMYLQNVAVDGKLVTGQNPWSTWAFSEAMVKKLGYQPAKRTRSAEEHAVDVLNAHKEEGLEVAKTMLVALDREQKPVDRNLIAMHSILAVMQWDVSGCYQNLKLLSFAAEIAEQ